jgi:hypothetical protein
LGSSEKRAYDASVDLLHFWQPDFLSTQDPLVFGRAGLLLAILGNPTQPHFESESAITALREQGLLAAHQALDGQNLLTALVSGCLGPPSVGCIVVLPSGLCADEASAIDLCRRTGSHHLLAIYADRQADARLLVQDMHIPLWPLGRTTGQNLLIRRSAGPEAYPFPTLLNCSLTDLASRRPQP